MRRVASRVRGRLLVGLVAVGLMIASGGALVAHAGGSGPAAPACAAFSTVRITTSAACMNVPWQLEGVGPNATRIEITGAGGCFAGPSGGWTPPTAVVHETDSTIRIRVFERGRPVIRNGRLDTTCGWSQQVDLRAPINGREIEGQSWPSHPGFGTLRGRVIGLPRVLGLVPAQAVHLLWLEGFHAHLTGHGRQIVSQLPGWGMTTPRARPRPDPYSGVVTLKAGGRITIPTPLPAPKPGTRSGLLVGTLSPSTPGTKTVALFDSSGRLLARLRVPGQSPFQLKLRPGHYLLVEDTETWISCGPARVGVRAGHVARVTVGFACGTAY